MKNGVIETRFLLASSTLGPFAAVLLESIRPLLCQCHNDASATAHAWRKPSSSVNESTRSLSSSTVPTTLVPRSLSGIAQGVPQSGASHEHQILITWFGWG